jgi:hypothetical protein
MRRLGVIAAAALLAGAPLGCRYGSAPRCASDPDCEQGRRCIVAAGVCVGFDTPLLPAPDAGPEGGADDSGADDSGAAGDGPTDAGGGPDAPDAAGAGG